MKLPESTRRMAELVGNGDRTAGVERLFAQLPLFYKVKIYLEDRVAQGDCLAEKLLTDLEDLEIERIHSEVVADGAIELPGGSWIV